MGTPIFAITDGTTRVNLLVKKGGSGINACDYEPGRPVFKNDGTWADSSLSDGRQLQARKWTNIIDVLMLTISGNSQDDIIDDARNLTALLEKAIYYWTTEWQNEPVWIERRGSNETETSYSLIHSYKWENDKNPFAPPFYVPSKPYAMQGVSLAIEHGVWLSNPPGESECVEISNIVTGTGIGITDEPTAQADDGYIYYNFDIQTTAYPTAGTDDAYVDYNLGTISTGGNNLLTGETATAHYGLGIRFRNVQVPNGATIVAAYINFVVTAYKSTALAQYSTGCEINATPAAFSTYADFIGRTYQFSGGMEDFVRHYVGDIVSSPVNKIDIQAVVDLPGWASGNDMVVILRGDTDWMPPATTTLSFASFDNPTYNEPELVIIYEDADGINITSKALKVARLPRTYYTGGHEEAIGVRYRGVAIPAGSTILSAYANFQVVSEFNGENLDILINGEDNATPAIFSTYADFIGRTKTSAQVTWNGQAWAGGVTVKSPDIKTIIQEIVDLGAWVSGNDIVLFFYPSGSGTIYFASFDHASYSAPELEITYASGGYYGRIATCSDEVYVSNKDNTSAIDNAYHYDTSTATWVGNLIGTATPFDLFPNPIGVGDMLYLGCTTGPFCSVVFDIETIGDTTIQWEYSQGGGAWANLTVVADRTNYDDFLIADVGALVWEQPDDWAMDDPAGAPPNAYWVRARVTNAATITPTQQNRDIYTVISSDIEIDEDEIGGDIPAIAKINTVTLDTTRGEVEKLLIGIRSISRGENFRQHINTDLQNNAYITITADVDTAIRADLDRPTGSSLQTQFTAPDTMQRRLYFEIDNPLAQQYYGRYRAFMRGQEVTAIPVLSDGEIQSYLNVSLGSSTASKTVGNIGIGDDWYYFDYGIITIPPALIPEAYYGTVQINVYASSDCTSAADFDWIDLILFPVDEYALEIQQDAGSIANVHDITTADSLSYIGKSNVFSVLRDESTHLIKDIPLVIASAPLQLQARTDQRVYFFVPDASKYEWLGRIQMWKNERYLTFRGDA